MNHVSMSPLVIRRLGHRDRALVGVTSERGEPSMVQFARPTLARGPLVSPGLSLASVVRGPVASLTRLACALPVRRLDRAPEGVRGVVGRWATREPLIALVGFDQASELNAGSHRNVGLQSPRHELWCGQR